MSISNIDELLMGGNSSQQPMSPEEKIYNESEPEPIEEMEPETPDYDESEEEHTKDSELEDDYDDDEEDDHARDNEQEDEYGNKKERMPKGMKERFDRRDRKHQQEVAQRDREIAELRAQLASQGASSQVQKAARDFEYDPHAAGDWRQQLAQFVRQEFSSMTREEQENQRRYQEEKAQAEFREKFQAGMNRFDDFIEVVEAQPIDSEMAIALRAMADPTAFIYAAAKRHPQELERISKLRDPYARIVEMGKLEERMRKNKPTTKAPRPLGRTPEDATTKAPAKQKDTSGDDLLAKADAKRMATVKTRLRSNR